MIRERNSLLNTVVEAISYLYARFLAIQLQNNKKKSAIIISVHKNTGD